VPRRVVRRRLDPAADPGGFPAWESRPWVRCRRPGDLCRQVISSNKDRNRSSRCEGPKDRNRCSSGLARAGPPPGGPDRSTPERTREYGSNFCNETEGSQQSRCISPTVLVSLVIEQRCTFQVSLHGIIILSLFAWTALVGSMALLGPSLPLLLIPLDITRQLYRRWSGFVALMWFSFATFMLEHYGKVRRLSCDGLQFCEESLVFQSFDSCNRLGW
jgi:hypothetical protein